MKKYLVITIILLAAGMCLSLRAYRAEKQERRRAERNVAALTADVEHYATGKGDMAARIAGLELSGRELERLLPELRAEVADLRVKLKNAQSVTRVETRFEYVNRDSVVYVLAGDSLRVFTIDDPWIKASVTVRDCALIPAGGFRVVDIPNRFTAVPEVTYRGWWLWRRAVGVRLAVKCSNPYVKMTDGVFVELKRR